MITEPSSSSWRRVIQSHVFNLAVAVGVAWLCVGPGLGAATLWEPDEPRFAEATRQMFARGDFLTPYFNGVPRFEKPILFYWLQAIAYHGLGPTPLAARVPSAAAAIGIVVLVYLIGVRLASRRAALIAALVMATLFRFVAMARQGLTDVPVLFFIVAALYGFLRGTGTSANRAGSWLAWTAIGLGVLTKGPIGLLPLVIWGAYAAVRRNPALVTATRPLAGLALAAAIAVPWYVLMIAWHGRAFVDFALGHEIVARVMSEQSFAPARGPFYYLKIWPGDAAPWSIVFVTALAWAVVRWRQLDARTREAVGFAVLWFAAVFLVFALPRSKVPHYVLPAYPAAALVIGIFVDRTAEAMSGRWWWRLPMGLIAIVTLAAAPLLAFALTVLAPGAAWSTWVLPVVLAAGGAAMLVMLRRQELVAATVTLAMTLAGTFAAIGAIVVPAVLEAFKPMPHLARTAAPLLQQGERLGLVGRYGASSLIYYSGHDVEWLLDDDAAIAFMSRRADAVCVLPATDFERLAPRLPGARVIASAQELNVRLGRLLERQRTPGRQWLLVAAAPLDDATVSSPENPATAH